jgi:4-hydroxy-3-methylbut-2-enyl diphosphate reductase
MEGGIPPAGPCRVQCSKFFPSCWRQFLPEFQQMLIPWYEGFVSRPGTASPRRLPKVAARPTNWRRPEIMRVLLAQPRGFCAGVVRAIDIVERALKKYGPPIYVRHEIVHNRHVVEDLRQRGAVFVDELDEVPEGAITVFSAHGVAKKVQDEAVSLGLPVIDATCPLVAKVHAEGRRYAAQDREIVLIGHAGHAEVEGTIGQIPAKVHLVQTVEDVSTLSVPDADKLAYVTQTTLSVDDTRGIIQALQTRFPTIQGPDVRDICYATQNRQQAVRDLAQQVDVILVVGSRNSSNSNRLRELGEELGCTSYLIDDEDGLKPEWFAGVERVGVTAGASAPEVLVQGVLDGLRRFGDVEVGLLAGVPEDVRFRLPPEVADVA